MASLVHLMVLVCVIVAEVQGGRFNYWKRYRPKDVKYTPYAYSNYINFSPNGGWRQDSSYIKYVPQARQSQTYKFYRGPYTPHINMYALMAGSDSYSNRRIPEGARVCANYDANDDGDVMGVFTCPNQWEPSNFTQCCGQDYAEFCCNEKSQAKHSWVTILGVVGGILAALVIVAIVVVVCLKKQKQEEKTNPKPMFSGRSQFEVRTKQVPPHDHEPSYN